mmetsp:Transcript_49566/g.146451  ORF Transcript_49566/g.146451 Transcript_49566/m.146451 type:complete len:225 (-) Transcript_49566:50-724(-)
MAGPADDEAKAKQVPLADCPPGEHPLETAWTLWVDKKSSDRKASSAYMEGLKQLGTFSTVEGFLRLWAHLKKCSTFPLDFNLLCFREGSKPMWEEFPEGGCWNYRMRRATKEDGSVMDSTWEACVLSCIGEAFATPDVVGCVMGSRHKEIALSVWNASNTRDTTVRFKIGERLREVLHLKANALLEYKDFQASIADFSTYRNAQAYIATPQATPEVPERIPRGA